MPDEQPVVEEVRGEKLDFNTMKKKECTQTQNKSTLPKSLKTDEELTRLSRNEGKSSEESSYKEKKVRSEVSSEG